MPAGDRAASLQSRDPFGFLHTRSRTFRCSKPFQVFVAKGSEHVSSNTAHRDPQL